MIADMSTIILAYSSEFVKHTTNTFEYAGITYDDVPIVSTAHGIMTPVEDIDAEIIISMGYTLIGKVLFFMPGTETLLTENDTIIDSTGLEWTILPKNEKYTGFEDWREHGNFVKYILSRKVL